MGDDDQVKTEKKFIGFTGASRTQLEIATLVIMVPFLAWVLGIGELYAQHKDNTESIPVIETKVQVIEIEVALTKQKSQSIETLLSANSGKLDALVLEQSAIYKILIEISGGSNE